MTLQARPKTDVRVPDRLVAVRRRLAETRPADNRGRAGGQPARRRERPSFRLFDPAGQEENHPLAGLGVSLEQAQVTLDGAGDSSPETWDGRAASAYTVSR